MYKIAKDQKKFIFDPYWKCSLRSNISGSIFKDTCFDYFNVLKVWNRFNKLVIEFIFTVTPSKVVITRVQTNSLSNKSAKCN